MVADLKLRSTREGLSDRWGPGINDDSDLPRAPLLSRCGPPGLPTPPATSSATERSGTVMADDYAAWNHLSSPLSLQSLPDRPQAPRNPPATSSTAFCELRS